MRMLRPPQTREGRGPGPPGSRAPPAGRRIRQPPGRCRSCLPAPSQLLWGSSVAGPAGGRCAPAPSGARPQRAARRVPPPGRAPTGLPVLRPVRGRPARGVRRHLPRVRPGGAPPARHIAACRDHRLHGPARRGHRLRPGVLRRAHTPFCRVVLEAGDTVPADCRRGAAGTVALPAARQRRSRHRGDRHHGGVEGRRAPAG